MMVNLLKKFLVVFFLLSINQSVMAKPVPPGSGEGDVPANILILLDNSKSMKNNKIGLGLENAHGVTIDGSGNKIISSSGFARGGLFKFDSAGDPVNFEGVTDAGATYSYQSWHPMNATDRTCQRLAEKKLFNRTAYIEVSNGYRRASFVNYQSNVTIGSTTFSGLIFFLMHGAGQQGYILGLNESTLQCEIAIKQREVSSEGTLSFDVKKRANGDLILVAFGKSPSKKTYTITYCNISQQLGCEEELHKSGKKGSEFGSKAKGAKSIVLGNDANRVFLGNKGIYGFDLSTANVPKIANSNVIAKNCPGGKSGLFSKVQDIYYFDVSDGDDDVVFGTGSHWRILQRIVFTGSTCKVSPMSSTGKKGGDANIASAGALASNKVNFGVHRAVNTIGNKVLVSHGAYADEFRGDLITAAGRNTAWQNQIGGGALTRWDGAKKALLSIFTDSNLTSGANFGFGWWAAGENNKVGWYCDKHGTNCKYWTGWDSTTNQQKDCKTNFANACMPIPVGPEGASDAVNILNTIPIRGGTDSHAWSQIAQGYFDAGAPNGEEFMYDEESTCQLNYVIIISDGMMRNHGIAGINAKGQTAARVTALRTKGRAVKTLMVAYGDGIYDQGMRIFDELAYRGSCDATSVTEAANRADCEPTIVARTPSELKTLLSQKIRQILAEKLAFTAPSITATIQQGGSLYQAQFAYEQYGEWQGTILRKEILGDGTVFHERDHQGNWDAAEKIRKQALNNNRNIWTQLPTPDRPEDADTETDEEKAFREAVDYRTEWNNFNTDDANTSLLGSMFARLEYDLVDYHNASSECSTANQRGPDVGVVGTDDEMNGLIDFVRGQDYFDYNGNCNITEIREHVLGDIYHSQLIEIGPPDGNTDFDANNEEAYYRSIRGYKAFQYQQRNRKNILYAGSNSGLLHAIDAKTGEEKWGFIPPFIAGKLPTMINKDLDGKLLDGKAGGSNAIFGVDGSPVVHDVWIRGLDPKTPNTVEPDKSWRTILFVPYGRGGSGFSVLDVTNPIIENSIGPMHMFSVYNDMINSRVLITNYKGDTKTYPYQQTRFNLEDSREAKRADLQLELAKQNDKQEITVTNDDGSTYTADDFSDYTNRAAIDKCKGNTASGKFFNIGDTSCYEGKEFNFDLNLADDGTTFDLDTFEIYEMVGAIKMPLEYTSAKMVDGFLRIVFKDKHTYNVGESSEDGSVDNEKSNVFLQTSCGATEGIPSEYDYSKLGETWSTPRIVRLPSPKTSESDDISTSIIDDKYVAIMGAGMSSNYMCAGSALYLIELDNMLEEDVMPGRLFGHEENNGPILIADTEPTEVGEDGSKSIKGSDITNAVPTNPIVITPDTAPGITWRGALVYINDREGKITKINLTNMDVAGVEMFDQTTLFNLNANTDNKRYTFFSMDAGIGVTTKDFWLFGGTGNFNALGQRSNTMDNIMYGIRDVDYPSFKHLNGVDIPLGGDTTGNLLVKAAEGALKARSIDDVSVCVDATGKSQGTAHCPDTGEDAWKVRLDSPNRATGHSFRKTSAPPTLFKGQVYFPVYEPPPGTNKCAIGNAYICLADDECGTNNTFKLVKGRNSQANDEACLFVRQGVLSELVIFGDKLFANVAGPSEDEDTLYSILAAPGEVIGNSSGWRESGF